MDRIIIHRWIPVWDNHLKMNVGSPLMCGTEFESSNWTGNDGNVTCTACILLMFAKEAENDSSDRGEPSK